LLKQPQYQPLSVPDQIVALIAVNSGALDHVPLDRIQEAKRAVRDAVKEELSDLRQKLSKGEALSQEEHERLVERLSDVAESMQDSNGNEA
jgi:F-type H+-transporting ATPase subunit alpha